MSKHVAGGSLALFLVALLPTQLQAQYLDPGSGSILIQVLLGGVVGLAAVIKLYWHKLKRIFGSKSAPSDGR